MMIYLNKKKRGKTLKKIPTLCEHTVKLKTAATAPNPLRSTFGSKTISDNRKPFKMMKNAFYFMLKAFFVQDSIIFNLLLFFITECIEC